jgi:PilZ domain-containing protein
MYEAARNLRTAERFLLAPPLAATFGSANVAICDISAKGARFRHDSPLEMGSKSVLKFPVDGRPGPVNLEAVIVWSQAESSSGGKFVSGVRTYGQPEVVDSLLTQLHTSRRSNRIEELRSTDRFFVIPVLKAAFGDAGVYIEDLSARGARVETVTQLPLDMKAQLAFGVPDSSLEVAVSGRVVWSSMKSITSDFRRYRAGLMIGEKPELMRLAIGHLSELGHAVLDTQSLRLKLKILRARARQLAPSYTTIEESGIPAEQFLLIQGVREELRHNPEEAFHWYRRARISINDPQTRAIAPPIADHPDALAVWEYLDRSVDPTIIGRAFALP